MNKFTATFFYVRDARWRNRGSAGIDAEEGWDGEGKHGQERNEQGVRGVTGKDAMAKDAMAKDCPDASGKGGVTPDGMSKDVRKK